MTTQTPRSTDSESASIKTAQREMWATGDYAVIGANLYPTAEVLCADIGFAAGSRVLDAACGSGNVALAAARHHADVVGVDFVPSLLDRARQRAVAEGLEITFREADVEALPFADASFDVVLSAFGVMFAPDPEKAAAELLRVCRPGGTIGLANWTPASAAAEMFRLSATFAPPPPGLADPLAWGTTDGLRHLFANRVRSIQINDRVWLWRHRSADRFVDAYRTYFGPVHHTFAGLDHENANAYAAGLADIAHHANRATDGTIAAAFTYVTVRIDR